MMYVLNPSILERQRAHLQETNNNFSIENFFSLQGDQVLGDVWPSLTSTPHLHAMVTNMREEELVTPTSTTTTISNSTSSIQASKGKTSSDSKKRKADKSSDLVGHDDDEKKMKVDHGNINEGEKKQGNNSSNENTIDKKQDYIHVRARRGQATDSHSLAERVRREKISERMKYLQALVPGCNKITGKAGMLDEIINYVQSLQRQVEFLSMKLATVNPRLDFNMEALLTKEMNLPLSPSGMSPEIVDPAFLQFSSLQQAISSCGLDMAITPTELALRRTISAPVSVSGQLLDSCFNVQRTNSGWENDMNNLYGPAFPFHSLQGNLLPNNLKTEM